MADLLKRWKSLLIPVFILGAILSAPRSGEGRLLDAILAQVEGATIAASDIAVARALGFFGFSPSTAPIGPADLERFIDARLIASEAARLTIEGSPADVERAWEALKSRAGESAAWEAWLRAEGISGFRVRKMLEENLRWKLFIDLRFRAFAIVTEFQISESLGPGHHGPEERERARRELREREVRRRLDDWSEEKRERAAIRKLEKSSENLPLPFPMPPWTRKSG